MKNKDILVCITNHNSNDNAIILKKHFSEYFETIIIDSKSNIINNEFDIKLDNIYFSGLFNESVNQSILRNKKKLYFIASDVFVDCVFEINDIISNLDDDIYLWAPSSKGQSHFHCKNFQSFSYREVPYVEGFTFLVNLEVVKSFYPVSLDKNLYGYGIDLIMGYNCIKKLGKKCVVDDRVEVYHREGTGYNQDKALQDMYDWMLSEFDDGVKEYTGLYRNSWKHSINSSDYKKLLNYLKIRQNYPNFYGSGKKFKRWVWSIITQLRK